MRCSTLTITNPADAHDLHLPRRHMARASRASSRGSEERDLAAHRDLDVGAPGELRRGRMFGFRPAGRRCCPKRTSPPRVGIGRGGSVEQREAVVDAGVDIEDEGEGRGHAAMLADGVGVREDGLNELGRRLRGVQREVGDALQGGHAASCLTHRWRPAGPTPRTGRWSSGRRRAAITAGTARSHTTRCRESCIAARHSGSSRVLAAAVTTVMLGSARAAWKWRASRAWSASMPSRAAISRLLSPMSRSVSASESRSGTPSAAASAPDRALATPHQPDQHDVPHARSVPVAAGDPCRPSRQRPIRDEHARTGPQSRRNPVRPVPGRAIRVTWSGRSPSRRRQGDCRSAPGHPRPAATRFDHGMCLTVTQPDARRPWRARQWPSASWC